MRIAATADLHFSPANQAPLQEQLTKARDEADVLVLAGDLTNYGQHYVLLAVTVWASLIGVVMFGTLAGSMLPFILRRLGFDPAASSAPFVATLVDVTGLCIYFLVALLILRGTLL